ncbi:MAG TPA: acyltransferase family protein, partial [Acidimicrobiia bacterium]
MFGLREPDVSRAAPARAAATARAPGVDGAGRGSGARLPYLPGLDGLRAVSVVAVLLYHYRGDRSLLRGGFLGVEVFFVISGYLITSLLLAESRTSARIDLRQFWARRIRRLWPALVAMMLVTGLIVAIFYHEDLGRLRGDLAFGFYAENWWHIVHGVSYVDLAADAGRRQPFQHLWSLAVEEQFYVVWPLLFVLGRWFGLGRLRVFTAVIAVLSWLAMVWFATHGNQNHAYLGTEARAYGPLVGALLAFVYPPRRRSVSVGARAGAILDLAGAASLIGLATLFVTARQTSTWLYVGGFPLTDLFTVVLITVIVSPAADVSRVLGSRPLQWIGLRSYGIYLWGIGIFEFTRPNLDLHTPSAVTLVLRVLLVAAVVELSFRFVETPVRRGAFLSAMHELRVATGERRHLLRRRWRVAGAGVIASVLFLGAAAVAARPPNDLQIVGGHTAVGGGDCVVTGKCALPTAPAGVTATTSPRTSTTHRSRPGSTTPPTSAPVSVPGWKVSAVGDSVLLGASSAVEHTLTGPVGGAVLVNAAVSRHAGTCLQVL